MFIASPVVVDNAEIRKRLKKENVIVYIINFGEETNDAILSEFVNTINGKEGTGSHFVSIAAPANLSDALFSSSIFQSEDGGLPAGFGPGYQFGMEDDPELAMALRISMEETRLKQEADAKKASGETMETDVNQRKIFLLVVPKFFLIFFLLYFVKIQFNKSNWRRRSIAAGVGIELEPAGRQVKSVKTTRHQRHDRGGAASLCTTNEYGIFEPGHL